MKKEQKKLYRIKEEAMIGGVCAGLGEYLDIDPTVIRVIWVVVFLMAGTGLLIYLILWALLPKKNETL